MKIKPVLGTQLNTAHRLNQGLVGCWLMNERAGDIANDISGYGNNGDLINSPEWVPSPLGGSLDFDPASNQYIDCGTGLGNALGNGVSALSVSMWFKADTAMPSLGAGLIDIGDFLNTLGEITLNQTTSNSLQFRLSNGAFAYTTPFSDTLEWHHIIMMYTGSKGQLYLDNVKIIDKNHSTNLDLAALKTIIGGYYSATARTFDGQIDDVRIYNRALSASEIRELYDSKF